MSCYPIVLTGLAASRCIVVGGGAVAERKVAGLLDAGARPTVVSPALTTALAQWREAGRIEHVARPYADDDLDGASLVIAATDDNAVNALVAADAGRRGALVNVADDPALGNFHTVGAVRQGDLLLTVSTGGQSPALAAELRAELAARYGPEYGAALRRAAQLRALPDSALAGVSKRALATWLCSEQALGWLREGNDDLVDATVQRAMGGAAAPTREER